MVSQRKRAARAAAKRIPLVGTAVVVAPAIGAASVFSGGFNMDTGKTFVKNLAHSFTGINPDTGTFDFAVVLRTYGPIVAYMLARRFAGRHISRVLRPLGVKF